MAIKKPQVSIDEVMKHLDERSEEAKKIENEIRSSTEYICWIRDVLKEYKEGVDDFEIVYKKDKLEEKTYENICNLSHFYSIIRDYWEKYKIPPTYIDYDFGAPVYRVFYEDFYFEICRISYLEGYVSACKTEDRKDAINYKEIMEDKEPKKYKEKEKFIKEFHEQIMKSKEKAEELDIDIEYLKKVVKDEFKL